MVDTVLQNPVVIPSGSIQVPSITAECETIPAFGNFHESNTGLLLYPNPVKGQAAISWDPAVKAEKLLLVGAAGTILKQILLSPGVNALALDFSFLARGIYFCVVIDNSGFSTRTQFLKE